MHLAPGASLALVGENGSGKTTLIKLLTRLYQPTSGRILLDGRDLAEWDEQALRERIGVIFQDFTRYQMLVGENVGAGDERYFEDEPRWRRLPRRAWRASSSRPCRRAIRRNSANGSRTAASSREGSGRRSRSRGRSCARARISWCWMSRPRRWMPQAEADIFEHFRQLAKDRITILISHRFSTVRMADQIAVLDRGRIVECGSHEELMERQWPLRAPVHAAGARVSLGRAPRSQRQHRHREVCQHIPHRQGGSFAVLAHPDLGAVEDVA